jgi:hypothetical protein
MITRSTTVGIRILRLAIILSILITASFNSFSQQQNLTEDDVITKAKSLFEKKDYQAALPLYAQLVSVHPENADYNFYLGVCTLFGDRKDKKKPIRYLNNAAPSMKDNSELNYYLGLAYHQNQEFANAMKFYNQYLSKLSSGSSERPLILEKINACLNGLNLIDKNLISEIVSSSKFQKDNFHRAYIADDLPGSLVLKPEIFQTDKDKKSGENSYVLLTQSASVLYYSGYSGNGSNDREIFKVTKDETGEYGIPEKLDETINTSFDENYPVLTDNGSTLYFCSNGHNSLGGYDIYRSKLDPVTKKFAQPENLGPGINSPFDDILFIITKDKEYAWFASDRDNLNGSITVFKVKLIENPFNEGLSNGSDAETLVADLQSDITGTITNNNGNKPNQNETAIKGTSDNRSDPSKKGSNLVNDRTKSAILTDSVFTIIANAKDLIRELTNKRDRANSISQRKSSEAKELELRFEAEISALAMIENKTEFEVELEKTIKLKEEILQLHQRSDQANKIAWILGNQIKFKNEELIVLKNSAAKIQSISLTGSFEETLVLYTGFINQKQTSDTLKDYSSQLISITNNEVNFDLPESEFAYAENLKKAFNNHTLLAEVKNQKPVVNENIPIVVVDKRTNIEDSNAIQKTPVNNLCVPIALVEPVIYKMPDLLSSVISGEQLMISFYQDNTMDPFALVQPVQYQNMESSNYQPIEINLEIRFTADQLSPKDLKPVIHPVYLNELAYNTLPIETGLDVSFIADQVVPEKIIQPVFANIMTYSNLTETETLEISFTVDKPAGIESLKLVEPVYSKSFNYAALGTDEPIEINFNADKALAKDIKALIDPVFLNSIAFNTLPSDPLLEINFFADQVIPEGVVKPVLMSLYLKDPTEKEELEISFNIDKPEQIEAIKNIEPVYSVEFADNRLVLEQDLEIEFSVDKVQDDQVLALIEPVYVTNYTENNKLDELQLELNFFADQVNPVNIIYPIAMNYDSNFHLPDPEDLEVSNSKDDFIAVKSIRIVEPVMTSELSSTYLIPDENLEINFNADGTEAIKLVSPVIYTNYTSINNLNIDSSPEIRFTVDQPAINESVAQNNVISNEPVSFLETSANVVEIIVPQIVEAITYASGNEYFDSIEPTIEIRHDIDQTIEILPVIDAIAWKVPSGINFSADEEIEITFSTDVIPQTKGKVIVNPDLATNDNTPEYPSKEVTDKSSQTGELTTTQAFYLRASILQSKTIETSKSDNELLENALSNPDELSYEELLYAASLATKPSDKLAIYNVAFVHVDRDWRAFNNASVSAIQSENLNQADCYLFQASLLSSDNPQIKNNMGILACHQKDYTQAEEYFIAASTLGYDARYNLQVVNSLEKQNDGNSSGGDIIDISNSNDIIVEIIDYSPVIK